MISWLSVSFRNVTLSSPGYERFAYFADGAKRYDRFLEEQGKSVAHVRFPYGYFEKVVTPLFIVSKVCSL